MISSASYNALVHSVTKYLFTEAGHSLRHLHHASNSEIREIVDKFLVVRPPLDDCVDMEEEEELYKKMDALLELELKNRKTIVDAEELPTILPTGSTAESNTRGFEQIALWKGDITILKATAIVNAANSELLGCFQPSHKCIDNVIHSMAGPRLRAACNIIMSRQAHEEPVGYAQITPGFALPADYVLHTVGLQLHEGSTPTAAECSQLKSCYTRSLDLLLLTVGDSRRIAYP